MSNYTIPNIPVLATQLNDTDLFEKADGPSSGQSQRFTGAILGAFLNQMLFGTSDPVAAPTNVNKGALFFNTGNGRLWIWLPSQSVWKGYATITMTS
jgi:hypothetical protein